MRSASALVLLLHTVVALPQTLFHRQYVHSQYPADHEQFLRLPGGSTIIFGAGQYPGTGSLAKVNVNGQMAWERRVEFANFSSGGGCVGALVDLQDGTLLCAVQGWYPSDGAVARVDTNGILLWTTDLGMPVTDVILTSDGNCVAAGRRSAVAVGSGWDMHLFKLDLNGNLLWSNRYYEPGNITAFNSFDKTTYNLVEQTNGDLWLCFGFDDRVAVLCTSPTGMVQWSRYFASGAMHQATLFPGGHACKLLPGNTGTWLFGKGNNPSGTNTTFAVLLDPTGMPVTGRTFAGGLTTFLRDAYRAPDGTYWLFAGYQENMGPMETAFIHLNANCDLIGSMQLVDGINRPVVGFGVAGDGGFEVARVVPDTSFSNAPRELERFDGSYTLECDPMPGTLITQGGFTLISPNTASLAAAQGIVATGQPLLLTPRSVTSSPGCITTSVAGHATQVSIHAYPSPATEFIRFSVIPMNALVAVTFVDQLGRAWPRPIPMDGVFPVADLAGGTYTALLHFTNGPCQAVRFVKAVAER